MIKPSPMVHPDSLLLHAASKTRFSRRVLATLLAAFVAIVGLIAIAPALLDKEKIRAQFLTEVGQWVGSELASNGDFKLSLFPEFKATLNDVVAQKADAPLKLTAKTVEIGLSAWSALFGRIESTAIKFDRADIAMDKSALETLRQLWSKNSLGQSVAMAQKHRLSDLTSPDLSSISNRKLGNITFAHSSLTMINSNGTNEQLSNINGSMNWPNLYSSATLVSDAQWRGVSVNFDADIKQPFVFAAGGNSTIGLTIKSEPMTLVFQGNGNLVANFFADGSLSWKTPSMERFLQWTQATSTAGESIGEVELNANLITKDGKLLFNDIAMLVSGSAATGTLEIDPLVTPIKSSGTLAFKSVDLAALAAALPIGVAGTSPHDLHLLEGVDLDLRLSAEQATIAGYSLANAAGAIRIAKGDASVDLGTSEIAGGTVMGRLELSGPSTAKIGKLIAGMNAVHLDQLTDLPPGIPVLSGPLNGRFEIEGPYANLGSLLATGNGRLSLDLASGIIRNFNLETMQAALDQQSVFELPTVYAGMSEANAFAVKANVKNGVIVVDTADATIDGRRVTLSGALPLMSRGIALNGVITDTEPTSTTKSLPFFIGGTWWRPLVTTQSQN